MSEYQVHMLGVPSDDGGGRPGAAAGPAAVREAGLADHDRINDLGDVVPANHPRGKSAETRALRVIEVCEVLRTQVRKSVLEGAVPLVIGGDHSLAAGSLAGVAAACRDRGIEVPAVVWLDAHVDINTHESSPSGNLHGMPAGALLGYDIVGFNVIVDGIHYDRARWAFIGQRDVDPGEQELLERDGYLNASSAALHLGDVTSMVGEIIDQIAPNGAPFILSLDIDALDPAHAPGVDTPVEGGLSDDMAFAIVERLAQHGNMVAMDLVEVNPSHDSNNQTAQLAVALAKVALSGARPLFEG
jgi:arginase